MSRVLRVMFSIFCLITSQALLAAEDREVHLTTFLIDIDDIDSVSQAFTINFFLK